MTRFALLLLQVICWFKFSFAQMTYKVKSIEELMSQRLTRFYTKGVEQLSKKAVYPYVTDTGLGLLAAKDLKTGETILEIIDEYAISSFDPLFPEYKQMREEFTKLPYLSSEDQDMITLIFNIMYFRYSKRVLNKSRFMKIFHDNIPDLTTYTPTWEGNEKTIFSRLLNKTHYFNFEEELFSKDNPIMNYIFSFKIKIVQENSTRYLDMLTWDQIKTAANIAYSRSVPISFAHYKAMVGVKAEDISDADAERIGFIVLPGLDLINHEDGAPKLDFGLKLHKLVFQTNKKYKKDEEIHFSYPFMNSVDFFKAHSFLPSNAVKDNSVQKFDLISLHKCDNNETTFYLLCHLTKACKPEVDLKRESIFMVPFYSNNIYDNFYFLKNVLSNWQEEPITNITVRATMKQIQDKEISNLTLALALSEFLEPIKASLDYIFEEAFSFERLIEWYQLAEKKELNLEEFLNDIRADLPNKSKLPLDFHDKVKETIKFALYFYHNTLKTFKQGVKLYGKALDNLIEDLKEKIVDKY